jgi:hypothetical protein
MTFLMGHNLLELVEFPEYIGLASSTGVATIHRPSTMNTRIISPFVQTSLAIVALFVPLRLTAQELNCDVTVNYESISSTNKEFLVDFAREVKTYMNSYKWTNEDLGGEKIKCSLQIFFISASGATGYSAQIFVGSQRLIYQGDGKTTAVIRIKDDMWDFVYEKNQPMYHNEYRFDPLVSVLDFYAYVIIGYDFDTLEPLSGTQYFQRASNIVNLGASTSYSRGWTKSTGSYTRAGLIEELLNSRYSSLRQGIYDYHFNGLDLLASDRNGAFQTIVNVLNRFAEFKTTEGASVLIIRVFFDTKYLELADLFTDYPDPEIYAKLNAVDPSHQRYYDDYRYKRK